MIEQIKKIISLSYCPIDESEINLCSTLEKDLKLDIFTLSMLLIELEERYKVSITTEEEINLKTFNDLIHLIQSKL